MIETTKYSLRFTDAVGAKTWGAGVKTLRQAARVVRETVEDNREHSPGVRTIRVEAVPIELAGVNSAGEFNPDCLDGEAVRTWSLRAL